MSQPKRKSFAVPAGLCLVLCALALWVAWKMLVSIQLTPDKQLLAFASNKIKTVINIITFAAPILGISSFVLGYRVSNRAEVNKAKKRVEKNTQRPTKRKGIRRRKVPRRMSEQEQREMQIYRQAISDYKNGYVRH